MELDEKKLLKHNKPGEEYSSICSSRMASPTAQQNIRAIKSSPYTPPQRVHTVVLPSSELSKAHQGSPSIYTSSKSTYGGAS